MTGRGVAFSVSELLVSEIVAKLDERSIKKGIQRYQQLILAFT